MIPLPHRPLAAALSDALQARIPDLSLGLAGSVARGEHRRDSDLDLLLVLPPAFPRGFRFVSRAAGVRVNVLCVTPAFADRIRPQAWRFDAPELGYVAGTRVLHDIGGRLAPLVGAARRMLDERAARPEPLLAWIRARLEVLLGPGVTVLPSPQHAFEALRLLLDSWFLRRGLGPLARYDSIRPFELIGGVDPAVPAEVERMLPFGDDVLDRLRALRASVLEGAPPSSAARPDASPPPPAPPPAEPAGEPSAGLRQAAGADADVLARLLHDPAELAPASSAVLLHRQLEHAAALSRATGDALYLLLAAETTVFALRDRHASALAPVSGSLAAFDADRTVAGRLRAFHVLLHVLQARVAEPPVRYILTG